jgi:predicted DCC family thiol-disulfide oxidoreductase YuxK
VSTAAQQPVTVCYDGSCPLCRREIALYRRAENSAEVEWFDVSTNAPPEGLTREQAMARFHVRKADGEWASGAAANIALWQNLQGWRRLGKMASLPPMPWIFEIAYRAFLPVRPALQWMARRMEKWN